MKKKSNYIDVLGKNKRVNTTLNRSHEISLSLKVVKVKCVVDFM